MLCEAVCCNLQLSVPIFSLTVYHLVSLLFRPRFFKHIPLRSYYNWCSESTTISTPPRRFSVTDPPQGPPWDPPSAWRMLDARTSHSQAKKNVGKLREGNCWNEKRRKATWRTDFIREITVYCKRRHRDIMHFLKNTVSTHVSKMHIAAHPTFHSMLQEERQLRN